MNTIEEIREITKSKQLDISQALKLVECSANNGNSCYLFRNLSENAFQEFFQRGFRVSKCTDPFGVESIKVEW